MKAFTARFLLITTVLIGAVLFNCTAAHASSAMVSAGQLVTLNTSVDGTAPFTYQWYKDGIILTGATSSSYTISSFQSADAATYYAVISNSVGSTTSDNAVLTLLVANVAPAFTTQPASQMVTAGSAVTFTAAASGTPTPTFQWQKGGVNITGATSSSYSISSTVTGDAGSYTVVATNAVSSVTSNTATLTVNAGASAPIITTQPVGQTVTSGNSVTFTVVASGAPSPTYQWKKGGTNISGATSASYNKTNVTSSDAGTYTVLVSNSAGSVTSSGAVLSVNVAPAFTTQPASQTVTAGGSVTFTAAASGTPTPTYQWKKGGVNISGATSASYTIAGTVTGNAGSYTVVATNSVSAVTSNAATLTVNSAPAFTTQPASQTVTAGGSVTFTAAASGTPTPTYQWKKGGVNISGATSASYTIAGTVTGNAGSYTVVATNSVSATTSNTATLTVNAATSAPVFTVQPASQTVMAGGSVTFTAAATGNPSPSFQWQKNGVNISGATSASYTISGAAANNEASYTVTASNSVGTVMSNAALLSVMVAPSNAIITIAVF